MTTENERNAWLAHQAATKITEAREALTAAVRLADDARTDLRSYENGLNDLHSQGQRVAHSEQPVEEMRSALNMASSLHDRMQDGRRTLGRLDDRLTDGLAALSAGQGALDELERSGGDAWPGQVQIMRDRLDGLRSGTTRAAHGVAEAAERLTAVRRGVGELTALPLSNPAHFAESVTDTVRRADTRLIEAQSEFRSAQPEIEDAESRARVTAGLSAELAETARIAANPTPASAAVAQPAASTGERPFDALDRSTPDRGPER